jgi:hypothetical protein
MRFKTDENLPIERAELLRQSQLDARSVARARDRAALGREGNTLKTPVADAALSD